VHPKRRKKHEAKTTPKKSKARALPSPAEETSDHNDKNLDLEATYLRSSKANEGLGEQEQESRGDDSEEEMNDDDESSPPKLVVHESLTGNAKSKSKVKTKKQKNVPTDETPAQRDQRTIFIGNLALDVAQKRVRSSLWTCKPRVFTLIYSLYKNNYSDTSSPSSPPPKSNLSDSVPYPSALQPQPQPQPQRLPPLAQPTINSHPRKTPHNANMIVPAPPLGVPPTTKTRKNPTKLPTILT
jgi:hypothetical protein